MLLVVVLLLCCAGGGPKIMVVVVCCGVDRALTGRDVGIGARILIVLSIDSYIGKNLNFAASLTSDFVPLILFLSQP